MDTFIKVLFIANSKAEGAYGIRARGLTRYFKNCKAFIIYRKRRFLSSFSFIYNAFIYNPSIIYVVNIAFAGVTAALFLKFFLRKPFIIDLGDINSYLFKATGRNIFFSFLAGMLEDAVLNQADAIVVRTNVLAKYLKLEGYRDIYVIPDGVETELFRPTEVNHIKNSIAPKGELIVGFVGALYWVKKRQWCYGIELIEALKILKHRPLKGLIIGGGSGLRFLKNKAAEYGLSEKIVFTGFIPYNELPKYINAMDVCLSTQTNDMVGRLRLTSKVPLYLACGKYILASDVGEVRHILPEDMRLDYKGPKDTHYPVRLAAALEDLLTNRDLLKNAISLRKLALEKFDYRILSKQVEDIIISLMKNN